MNEYFCGRYYKCQSDQNTLAIIAAVHRFRENTSCSVQLITEDGVWYETFPEYSLTGKKSASFLKAGKNIFCENGIRLHLHSEVLTADGTVSFGEPTPIRYDIMGPFRYVPFMECRHSVISMQHSVNGSFTVNGKRYSFSNALGYMEGDRGYSFPKRYVWTQCFFESGSLMLSVADIPLGSFHFTGIICVIHWKNREYRLATYLGAKAVSIANDTVVIRQGGYLFAAKLLKKKPHSLYAPVNGSMTRTIRESPSCHAAYRFSLHGKELFSFKSEAASFEYEY